MANGSSPHTRGALRQVGLGGAGRRIIPAYAGSTAPGRSVRIGRSDHPRIRGEHTTFIPETDVPDGSSPHTRGARGHPRRTDGAGRIIPAYAGSTANSAGISCLMRGSSPHTRGARADERGHLVVLGIIPAYAGSTKLTIAGLDGKSDHPRIRGEHPLLCRAVLKVIGSSPHTRGALRHTPSSKTWIRIIPAYAGSTTALASQAHSIADHPRIRGEHDRSTGVAQRLHGSSPHTRGALLLTLPYRSLARIIPAYAGSTRASATNRRCWADHPRIRGEHGELGRHFLFDAGIIPAYAGSTCR